MNGNPLHADPVVREKRHDMLALLEEPLTHLDRVAGDVAASLKQVVQRGLSS